MQMPFLERSNTTVILKEKNQDVEVALITGDIDVGETSDEKLGIQLEYMC